MSIHLPNNRNYLNSMKTNTFFSLLIALFFIFAPLYHSQVITISDFNQNIRANQQACDFSASNYKAASSNAEPQNVPFLDLYNQRLNSVANPFAQQTSNSKHSSQQRYIDRIYSTLSNPTNEDIAPKSQQISTQTVHNSQRAQGIQTNQIKNRNLYPTSVKINNDYITEVCLPSCDPHSQTPICFKQRCRSCLIDSQCNPARLTGEGATVCQKKTGKCIKAAIQE